MPGKVKLTKEDKFTTFMLTWKDRVAKNWQFAVIGVVSVILLVVAVVYFINSRQSEREEAGRKFARALLDYRNGDRQVAILGLNQIVEEYSNDDVAEESTYLLGKLSLLNRDYPEATRYYEMYLSRYHNNPLNRAAALAGLASCLENQGEYGQAAAKFVEAAEEYPEGPLEGDYRLGAMRNFLEVNDISSAQAQLDILEKRFQGTDWVAKGLRLFYEKGQNQAGT